MLGSDCNQTTIISGFFSSATSFASVEHRTKLYTSKLRQVRMVVRILESSRLSYGIIAGQAAVALSAEHDMVL